MSRTSSDRRRASTTSRRRGVLAVLGLVAALGLSGCGGDDPAEPGSAAVAGQHRISVRDLQTAYSELGEIAKGPNGDPLPQTSLLSWMLLEPFAVPEAAAAGVAVSDDDVRTLLDQLRAQIAAQAAQAAQASKSPSPSPSPGETAGATTPSPSVKPGTYSDSTIEAVRGYLAIQNVVNKLGSEAPIKQWFTRVYDQLDAQDPEVSPRYGTYVRPDVNAATQFDQLVTVVGPETPDWFSDAVTAATPSPEAAPEDLPEETPAETSPTSAP